MYNNYLSALEKTFFDTFLTPSRNEYILNFKTFLKVFFEFVNHASQSGPITKTDFIASNFCYVRISGLAIWVADLAPSDDSQKQEFIDSPNFYYYEEFLKKHGFVDEIVPRGNMKKTLSDLIFFFNNKAKESDVDES